MDAAGEVIFVGDQGAGALSICEGGFGAGAITDPNPFAENTTINYFIPDNVNVAQLLFYDNSGAILKTVDIKEKGQGNILVYGSNLSSGIYTYALLADGKPIETKRMVKVK